MVEGWKNYCLKEIIDELIMGQSPDSSSYNNEEKGIAFIQGNADMQNGVPSIRMFTTDPKRYSELNDILLSVRAPVGDVFYNNYGNLSIGRGLSAIRIKNKHLRTLVYYWLNFDKKQFERLEQGTTFTEIGKKEVRNINVTIPTNSKEQAYIANILLSVDEAIESVKKSIEAAEKLKKSLMQNLLTGRMKPDGTLRTEEEFYEDEKFGKVPIGWEVKKVKEFGKVITGKTPPTEEPDVFSDEEHGYMFVTPGDVGASKYIERTERFVSEKGIKYSYRIPKDSICEICIGSTIGKIGVVTSECCTNQQVTSVVVNDCNYYDYFYYAMLSRKEHLKSIAGINATPQINKNEYSKYKIISPISKEEQIDIAQKISSIDIEINNKQSKIITLERLKKSLMQNLLTGKVRVGDGKGKKVRK